MVKQDLVKYLEDLGLISIDQHGFREGHSCTTQLLEIMEIWTEFSDQGLPWDCIYLDFAKAFDSVPHKRLINKLKSYGIRGKLLSWIADFLSERKQLVTVGDKVSSWAQVKSGIPQGSVLGPILFIIFINDLPDTVKAMTKIFADDTKLFKTITSTADRDIIQKDIKSLADWSSAWQLPFNELKCKVLHYGKNNPEYKYSMKGHILDKDDTEKDLGVTFDTGLNFRAHINNIIKKANCRVGIIKRHFTKLNKESFLLLYKTLVRPILEYAMAIWAPYSKHEINELEKVQRRATKLLKITRNKPYTNRLKMLNLTTLLYRRERNDMIQVYRLFKGFDKINKDDFFTVDDSHRTRGHQFKVIKPRCVTKLRQNTFSQRTINLWNSLPQEAVMADTVNGFKNQLQKAWLKKESKYEC